jgi:DNA-binding NtrC family response regulator
MNLVPSFDPDRPALASILVVERDAYAAELVEYLLRTEGYEVTAALDAADALALFNERRRDLVVVELVISGGSGLELCRRLCDAGARVVAVSALAVADVAVKAGAEAFLRKPLDPLQVLSTVKDLLGTSHLTRRQARRVSGSREGGCRAVTRLDDLLGGGLPNDCITLIAGEPGTGKTGRTLHVPQRERAALGLVLLYGLGAPR